MKLTHLCLRAVLAWAATWGATPLLAQTPQPAQAPTLAPSSTLRAVINLGNPILARRDAASGQVLGVSVDLAQALGAELGVPVSLQVVESAGQAVSAVAGGQADVGFFAIDPVRSAGIAFTNPYVLIEGSYLVRQDSPIRVNADVDQAGHVVAVGQASAYDLYLSRELKQARIVRAPTSPAVVDYFLAHGADVAAGVRQQLQADAARLPGLRLLEGRFMVIYQAMGLAKSRGPEALAQLTRFVETRKADGFVQRALERHGIQGAAVAPAGAMPAN